MKECPFCAEQIHEQAVQCKHCGRSLVPLPPSASPAPGVDVQRVTVIDVDMPFGSMVTFMFKLGLAAIPAALLLAVVLFIVGIISGGLIGLPGLR